MFEIYPTTTRLQFGTMQLRTQLLKKTVSYKENQLDKSTVHSKNRITVLLTAKVDGTKHKAAALKPDILLPRERPMTELIRKFTRCLEIRRYQLDERKFNSEKCHWLLPLGNERLLVWASFRCHTSELTKEYC